MAGVLGKLKAPGPGGAGEGGQPRSGTPEAPLEKPKGRLTKMAEEGALMQINPETESLALANRRNTADIKSAVDQFAGLTRGRGNRAVIIPTNKSNSPAPVKRSAPPSTPTTVAPTAVAQPSGGSGGGGGMAGLLGKLKAPRVGVATTAGTCPPPSPPLPLLVESGDGGLPQPSTSPVILDLEKGGGEDSAAAVSPPQKKKKKKKMMFRRESQLVQHIDGGGHGPSPIPKPQDAENEREGDAEKDEGDDG